MPKAPARITSVSATVVSLGGVAGFGFTGMVMIALVAALDCSSQATAHARENTKPVTRSAVAFRVE